MLIILSFYLLLLLVYLLACIFVAYHLVKYSINSSLNLLVLPLFIFVVAGLVFSSATLFFSIDWIGLWDKLTDIIA
ncbi:MAG: hypothetical protein ACOYS2_02485 [Patescibacteria group bacterium]